jgi:hypothetical protein
LNGAGALIFGQKMDKAVQYLNCSWKAIQFHL